MGMEDFKKCVTKEELNIIFLLDTSGSMYGERIQQLNIAMTDALEALKREASKSEIKVCVRVMEFNTNADWIVGNTEKGELISDVIDNWKDLKEKNASTDTAKAIRKVKEVMHTEYLGTSNFHPIVILVTDGKSDNEIDTKNAIAELAGSLISSSDPTKEKIQRIAVGVVDAKQSELVDFASKGSIEHEDGTLEENVPLVFNVTNVSDLANLLKDIAVSSILSAGTAGNKGFTFTKTEEDDDDENGGWKE